MHIKMETISQLASAASDLIKSEIKVEGYCDSAVAVTANTNMPPQQQQQQQQQQQHHHHQDLDQMHAQQNNCWVGFKILVFFYIVEAVCFEIRHRSLLVDFL